MKNTCFNLNLDLNINARVLASHLEKALPSVTAIEQSAFIKGRYSVHNAAVC